MSDDGEMKQMDYEHRAWGSVCVELQRLGVNLNDTTATPLVLALKRWGEEIATLRCFHSALNRGRWLAEAREQYPRQARQGEKGWESPNDEVLTTLVTIGGEMKKAIDRVDLAAGLLLDASHVEERMRYAGVPVRCRYAEDTYFVELALALTQIRRVTGEVGKLRVREAGRSTR